MVGMKLIKATFWHCQTNSLHLDIIAQILLSVFDLPSSTCVRVCVCLLLKHFLHRNLDPFDNDLVLFFNSFLVLFFKFSFSFIAISECQIKRVCLQ